MCEFSGNLVAWLDQELAAGEAARVEEHLGACADCRRRAAEYKEVSRGFAAYYEAAAIATGPRWAKGWTAAAAAALAAGIALVWFLPRTPADRLTLPAPPIATVRPPAMAFEKSPARVRPAHRRFEKAAQAGNAGWQSPPPQIQVVIPADAMFPPGAVPAGFHFIANVSIGADGSAQSFELHP